MTTNQEAGKVSAVGRGSYVASVLFNIIPLSGIQNYPMYAKISEVTSSFRFSN